MRCDCLIIDDEKAGRTAEPELLFSSPGRDIQSIIGGTASVYVGLMKIIVCAVLFLRVSIIAFVLFLLVRTMILSTAAGLVVYSLVINPLAALFLKGRGIVKCTFTVPEGFVASAGAELVLPAFGIACLLSPRIRKITPCDLLKGQFF